jgi:hypothetical protein
MMASCAARAVRTGKMVVKTPASAGTDPGRGRPEESTCLSVRAKFATCRSNIADRRRSTVPSNVGIGSDTIPEWFSIRQHTYVDIVGQHSVKIAETCDSARGSAKSGSHTDKRSSLQYERASTVELSSRLTTGIGFTAVVSADPMPRSLSGTKPTVSATEKRLVSTGSAQARAPKESTGTKHASGRLYPKGSLTKRSSSETVGSARFVSTQLTQRFRGRTPCALVLITSCRYREAGVMFRAMCSSPTSLATSPSRTRI